MENTEEKKKMEEQQKKMGEQQMKMGEEQKKRMDEQKKMMEQQKMMMEEQMKMKAKQMEMTLKQLKVNKKMVLKTIDRIKADKEVIEKVELVEEKNDTKKKAIKAKLSEIDAILEGEALKLEMIDYNVESVEKQLSSMPK